MKKLLLLTTAALTMFSCQQPLAPGNNGMVSLNVVIISDDSSSKTLKGDVHYGGSAYSYDKVFTDTLRLVQQVPAGSGSPANDLYSDYVNRNVRVTPTVTISVWVE